MITKQQFNQHKKNAKLRNVDFLLTYEEWCDIWNASGKAHLRGRGKGKYNMMRKGDTGPYAVGNVFIGLHEVNCGHGLTRTYKPVRLHGVEYPGIAVAARELGINSNTLTKRFVEGKPGHEYI